MSLEQFKVLVLDMVSTICAEMAERVRLAEEKASNFFVNRTNVYRAEDGRPICYCCLRVGHVAKYCWDRRYSCRHNREELPVMKVFPPVVAALDVTVRDSEKISQTLLEDLKRTLREVQETTAPFMPFMEEADSSTRAVDQPTERVNQTVDLSVNREELDIMGSEKTFVVEDRVFMLHTVGSYERKKRGTKDGPRTIMDVDDT